MVMEIFNSFGKKCELIAIRDGIRNDAHIACFVQLNINDCRIHRYRQTQCKAQHQSMLTLQLGTLFGDMQRPSRRRLPTQKQRE